jgi:hypothetical protein
MSALNPWNARDRAVLESAIAKHGRRGLRRGRSLRHFAGVLSSSFEAHDADEIFARARELLSRESGDSVEAVYDEGLAEFFDEIVPHDYSPPNKSDGSASGPLSRWGSVALDMYDKIVAAHTSDERGARKSTYAHLSSVYSHLLNRTVESIRSRSHQRRPESAGVVNMPRDIAAAHLLDGLLRKNIWPTEMMVDGWLWIEKKLTEHGEAATAQRVDAWIEFCLARDRDLGPLLVREVLDWTDRAIAPSRSHPSPAPAAAATSDPVAPNIASVIEFRDPRVDEPTLPPAREDEARDGEIAPHDVSGEMSVDPSGDENDHPSDDDWVPVTTAASEEEDDASSEHPSPSLETLDLDVERFFSLVGFPVERSHQPTLYESMHDDSLQFVPESCDPPLELPAAEAHAPPAESPVADARDPSIESSAAAEVASPSDRVPPIVFYEGDPDDREQDDVKGLNSRVKNAIRTLIGLEGRVKLLEGAHAKFVPDFESIGKRVIALEKHQKKIVKSGDPTDSRIAGLERGLTDFSTELSNIATSLNAMRDARFGEEIDARVRAALDEEGDRGWFQKRFNAALSIVASDARRSEALREKRASGDVGSFH